MKEQINENNYSAVALGFLMEYIKVIGQLSEK